MYDLGKLVTLNNFSRLDIEHGIHKSHERSQEYGSIGIKVDLNKLNILPLLKETPTSGVVNTHYPIHWDKEQHPKLKTCFAKLSILINTNGLIITIQTFYNPWL